VFAVVADASGAIIARSSIQQYGVDGTWIPTVSSRVDKWSANFGLDAATNGRTLGIVHLWDPKNRFFADLDQILTDVETLIGLIQEFCTAEPDICALITAALYRQTGHVCGISQAWKRASSSTSSDQPGW
jgi:hypothetical protein